MDEDAKAMQSVDPAAAGELRAALRGPVLAPGSAGYDEVRRVWNGMIDRRPALVARCLGVADVVAGVAWARRHGVPLTIKGGGHNISGLAVADGALTLDMSLRRGVWVDRERGIAHAESGCLLGDVDHETQLHGLAAVLGFVSETGVTGLTLGGGFGYTSRKFGWTVDNVRGFDLVTADGRLVRASAEKNEDLFWGLCGGGGNFGVVTGIDFELHPLGPEIVGGAIAWPAEETSAVADLYLELAAQAPPEMAVVYLRRIAPPAPWIAPEAHGKPVVVILVCHTGPLEEGERAVAKLKEHGKPVGDVIQRRPFVTQQSLLDATQPKGRRYYWKSEYLGPVTSELLEAAEEHSRSIPSPHGAVIVFPLGGAIGDRDAGSAAMGNRDAAAVLNITAAWDDARDDAANIEWARAAWRDLRRFSTGGTYVNFLTEEEVGDRIRDAYGANYERLVEIKSRWDPENLFRANKNIAPRG